MSKKLIRCNTSVQTNNASTKKIHSGKVNGKDIYADYYVIENTCHMIRNAVMNEGLYGDAVFDKLANSLMASNARIPAPLSHPSDSDGNFVDANDPITFASHNIGAFDSDWRVNNDKLVSNTYILVDSITNPKPENQWLADRVVNKLPIDRSTGLFLSVNDNNGIGIDGEPYTWEVEEIFELNHSAILDPTIEPGAKNNTEGCGMFTNTKGDKVDIEECTLTTNASTPAMKLPLAPLSHVFNEAQALDNIKAYTNSTDKPSTSYRKFFLSFNQDATDNFDSYTNLFADVIDNIPHAVKSQMNDSDYGKAYLNRFDSEMKGNSTGIVKTILNKLFKAIGGEESTRNNDGFVYRGDNGKMYLQQCNELDSELVFTGEPIEVVKIANEYQPIINKPESTKMDKAKLIALLAANGITANAEMSDADLETALNKALSDKLADPVVDTAVNSKIEALTATVEKLAGVITANSNKELDQAVADVVAMNKGIDEATAKTMGLAACNSFLAANGHVAFNARTNQTQVNSGLSLVDAEMPVFKELK